MKYQDEKGLREKQIRKQIGQKQREYSKIEDEVPSYWVPLDHLDQPEACATNPRTVSDPTRTAAMTPWFVA